MNQFLPVFFPLTWLGWALYWWFQSRSAKTNVWAESVRSRLMHVVPLVAAVLLVALPSVPVLGLDRRFLPGSFATAWVGFFVTATGLGFTVWARRHLATNWSGDVTVKENHELITSGPYRWVRHPIYSGLLLAFAGTALAIGEWRGIVSVVLVGLAQWRKLRIEERRMRQVFGERYVVYERRVSALIPFLL